MHLTNSKVARALFIALALTAATACKKKDAPPAADTMSMMPPAEPMVVALKVDGVETGKGLNADKTIKEDEHDFGVRDTIYVSVKTQGAGSGKLAAKFTYQDGQTVEESSQEIAPTGEAHHEFHMQKATAWPKGDYKVDVMLNGVSVGTKDFTIK